MRLLQSFILVVALFPGLAMALGLGKIQSNSALNEPFSARINLIDPTVEELDSLNVRLADVDAFRRAGIPRTRLLTELHFSIKRPETGADYIHIYSDDPVREPFLNFLIEVSWSKGRLYREYTVLLDPPVYIGGRTAKKAVQATAPAAGPVAPSGGEIRPIEDNKVVYNPEYRPSAPAAAPAAARQIDYQGGDYGPVVSGDTLWSIASAMRPDTSVSIQQTMLALLRANPEAFINNNINGLKRGHVLKMPDLSDIQSVSRSDAFAEAKLQNNLWEEARGALATAVTPRPEGAPAAPEQPAAPAPKAEAAPAPAMGEESELRLVAPTEEGEAGEQPGAASNEALSRELALANESLEALKLENSELRDKLSETEAIVDDLNRLIVLKENELAELQQQIATAEMQAKAEAEEKAAAAAAAKEKMAEKPAREPAAAKEKMAEKPAREPAAPKEKMAEKPAETAAPEAEGGLTSLIPPALGGVIDVIRNNLLYVAAAVIAILLLIVGSIYVKRRREEPAEEIPPSAFPDFEEMEEEAAAGAEDITDINPELEEAGREETLLPESAEETISPEFGEEADATQIAAPQAGAETAQAAAPEEEEDPLAEVNVFLAYEHFDQAEEFVKNALEKEPDNLEFHTKLLEVYYAANDKKGYEEAAKVLHDKVGGEGDYWNMAVAMWQEMSPNRELFAEPVAGEEEEAAGKEEGGGMLNIAGEEEGGEAKGLDLDFAATEEAEDLEFSDSGEAGEEDADILDVTAAIDMENEDEVLDVTAAAEESEEPEPVEEAEETAGADEEVLDISTGGDEEVLDLSFDQEETEEEQGESADDNSLDFSMDMAEEETAERSVEEAQELSFEEESGKQEPEQADEGSLDFSLDFTETGGEEAEQPEEGGAEMSFEMDQEKEDTGEAEESLDLSFDVGAEEETGESAPDEDSGLDVSLESESEEEKAGTEEALDFSLDLSETGGGEEEAEQADEGSLDMSLEMPGTEEEPAEEGPEFSLDLEESAPQGRDTDEKQDEDLLDVTSVSGVDDKSEPVEDILDVSKNKTDSDLLDVTKTTDFDVDKDEDLLDVTTSATGAGVDADELLGRQEAGEEEAEKEDIEGIDFQLDDSGDDSEGSGLDFELSPEESGDGAESTAEADVLDFSIDGGEDLEEGEESSPDIDMEATMQMPKRSKLDADSESENEEGSDQTIMVPRSGDSPEQSEEDEIASQLDLAKAYVELGDTDNAKTILNEVIEIGNDSQRQQAEELLGQLQ